MKSAENIQKLIHLLSQSSIDDYNSLLKTFDFNAINFAAFGTWSSTSYTRNCLYRDDKFELILICWEPSQETAIHGHDGEDCWVYVLEGEMEEVFYDLDEHNHLQEIGSQKVIPEQLTFMNDKIGFHRLKSSNTCKSLSLHVYAKPIDNCRFYDENTSLFVNKKLHYDTFNKMLEKTNL